jgi:hypothetical protein
MGINRKGFEATAVEDALRRSRAEVVIDELTSLPKLVHFLSEGRHESFRDQQNPVCWG